MKLTEAEISYIDQTLNKHGIKYQEVYDELKDHLMSAVESARSAGDIRSVEAILDEVIATQFPRWWPFDEIIKVFENAYRKKLWRNLYFIIKSYMSAETLVVCLIIAASGLWLPDSKLQIKVLGVGLYLMGMLPTVYTIYFAGKLKRKGDRKSLVGGQLIAISYLLLVILNVFFNLLRQIDKVGTWAFLNPINYPPVVFTVLLAFFLIYGISSIKLSRQEFKIKLT